MEQINGNNKVLAIYEDKLIKKISLPLFNEMPKKALQKEKEKKKTFKYVFNKIRLKKCASATISKPFPTYHVAYLGNVITGWAKGEGCIEKPLATLWRNYIQSSRPDVNMHLTVSGCGLKAVTKNHGLTEYWAHRLTTCAAPKEFPRIFCWVYRHEGRKLRQELRCHAALCSSTEMATQIEKELKEFLSQALNDFKRDKLSRQNARLSLVNSVQDNPSLPRRKILLGTGSHNYRPPLECSKSAPKLSRIEESFGEEEDDANDFRSWQQIYRNILKSYEKSNILFERGKHIYNCNNGNVKPYSKNVQATNVCPQTNLSLSNPPIALEQDSLKNETEEEKCDKTMYKENDILHNEQLKPFVSNVESPKKTSENHATCCVVVEENCKEKHTDADKKVDLDFKIGGEVLPAIKSIEKLPSIDHTFITPIITKGFVNQEQVSLVPVGETHTDFSSLKVYKKRNFSEINKDFSACAMFFSAENITQLENIFQTHCSFSGGDKSDEEITSKINSTVLV